MICIYMKLNKNRKRVKPKFWYSFRILFLIKIKLSQVSIGNHLLTSYHDVMSLIFYIQFNTLVFLMCYFYCYD